MSRLTANQAEELVANWLISRGCVILKRNHRSIGSELDIVAWTGHGLVVVEVKLRNGRQEDLDYPSLLPKKKRLSILRGSRHFVSCLKDLSPEWIRIDLAIVQGPDLTIVDYIPGVIQCEEAETSDLKSLYH